MKMMKLTLSALVLATVSAVASAQTSTWTIDSAHSSAEFSIKHLGVSTVRGSITGIKGTVLYDEKDATKSSVTAMLDANTVSTSNDARDKHLKSPDFFDAANHPTLTFKSTAVTKVNGKLQLVGDLTLGGVTKPVTLTLDGPAPPQKGMGGKIVSGFTATGTLKRSDFNFGSKFGSPTLGDEVGLIIDLEIDKQP